MKLVKQQIFTMEGRNGCASIYEYERSSPYLPSCLFAVCIYLEGKSFFVNRKVKTRADAEKIYNERLEKLKGVFNGYNF